MRWENHHTVADTWGNFDAMFRVQVAVIFILFCILLQFNRIRSHCDAQRRICSDICRLPLPPANFSTLYKDDKRFLETYFKKYPV